MSFIKLNNIVLNTELITHVKPYIKNNKILNKTAIYFLTRKIVVEDSFENISKMLSKNEQPTETSKLVLSPSQVTISKKDFINVGINFEISGSKTPDLGYHWIIEGIDQALLKTAYSDNADKCTMNLLENASLEFPLTFTVQAGDEGWEDEQYATVVVTG